MRVSTLKRCNECADEIRQEREVLHDQIEQLREKRHDLRKKMFDLEWEDQDITAIRQEIRDLETAIKSLEDERDALFDELMDIWETGLDGFFERPEEGFSGLLSKPLGPLPRCAKVVNPDDKGLATVGGYRVKGLLLLVVAIVCLISLVVAFPWMSVSPGSLILMACKQLLPWWLAMPVGLGVMFALMKLLIYGMERPAYEGKFLDQAAMYEEQWFRMGAESWNIWQRAYSCMSFGAVHLVNIIYPTASLIVVSCVGGAFMAAYLREYKHSGSYERAVLASTKLHAAYNRFAFLYMGAAICIMVGFTIAEWVS